MSSFPILDLVIGMIFIYFLLSIICSSAVELWFSILNMRSSLLTKWLIGILNEPALDSSGSLIKRLNKKGVPVIAKDKNGNPKKYQNGETVYEYDSVGKAILNHCMTTVLSKAGKSTSYIDAQNFVAALLDKITIVPAAANNINVQLPPHDLPAYIAAIQQSSLISGELKRTILAFANEATLAAKAINTIPAVTNVTNNITTEIKSDLEIFKDRLEKWFDTNANRLTGTFKRTKVLPTTVIVAVFLTIGLNADSILISRYLYSHPDQSSELAKTALSRIEQNKGKLDGINQISQDTTKESQDSTEEIDNKKAQLQNDYNTLVTSMPQGLPMGWSNESYDWWSSKQLFGSSLKTVLGLHWTGWLATILAICLGAPFWFDILNKIANLRGAGPKPTSSSNADVKNI